MEAPFLIADSCEYNLQLLGWTGSQHPASAGYDLSGRRPNSNSTLMRMETAEDYDRVARVLLVALATSVFGTKATRTGRLAKAGNFGPAASGIETGRGISEGLAELHTRPCVYSQRNRGQCAGSGYDSRLRRGHWPAATDAAIGIGHLDWGVYTQCFRRVPQLFLDHLHNSHDGSIGFWYVLTHIISCIHCFMPSYPQVLPCFLFFR